MRVYLAGPWARRDEVREAREQIRAAGFLVDCRWIDLPDTDEGQKAPGTLRREAEDDLEDLRNSDVLVLLNLEPSEGKATELGYALCLGMPVISVGETRNVFTRLSQVVPLDGIDDAIEELKERGRANEAIRRLYAQLGARR